MTPSLTSKMDRAFPIHSGIPPPKDLFPFHSFQPTIPQPQQATMPPPIHPTMPPPSKQTPYERAQAKLALRAERQQQAQAKYEIALLQAERHSVVAALKRITGHQKRLVESLEHIEAENEGWQTPNANLEQMYRLRDQIEQVEKQANECHRRWDELGEEIEEKHVEIAFGGIGGD